MLSFRNRIAIKKAEIVRLKDRYLNARYDYFNLIEAQWRYAFEHTCELNEAHYSKQREFFVRYMRAYMDYRLACEQLTILRLNAQKNTQNAFEEVDSHE